MTAINARKKDSIKEKKIDKELIWLVTSREKLMEDIRPILVMAAREGNRTREKSIGGT